MKKELSFTEKQEIYNYHQDLIKNDRGYGGSITKRVRERFSISHDEINEIRKEFQSLKPSTDNNNQ